MAMNGKIIVPTTLVRKEVTIRMRREAIELIQHQKLPSGIKRLLQETWDSHLGFVAVAAESHFLYQLCHRLVMFDGETKSFLPQLAHAWESNAEMTARTFYLRKGVRFHHGRVLTGRDVEYTVPQASSTILLFGWRCGC